MQIPSVDKIPKGEQQRTLEGYLKAAGVTSVEEVKSLSIDILIAANKEWSQCRMEASSLFR